MRYILPSELEGSETMRFPHKRALHGSGLPLVVICVLSVALGFSLAANFYHHLASSIAMAAPEKAPSDDWRTAFVDIANGVPVKDALSSAVEKFEAAAARVAQ